MPDPTGLTPSPDPWPQTPAAQPRPHGGRRPGAGAPFGNVNGIKQATYSRRAQAFFLLSIIPSLRDLRRGLMPGSSSAGRELARRLLLAAQWTIDEHPELSIAIESIIAGRLGAAMSQIQARLHRQHPRDEQERLQHALDFAGWAVLYHPTLRAELEAYLMELMVEAPDYPEEAPKTPKTTIKQSSNQV